ncbi:LytR/AlgR family response regulator transcription factor [Mangrovibacterium diazotrophicum]|uniref:LytTR family two component transcriptional regulator n=1 Tax=Mangrovibacterium diazotrophicum TaxID=1261403 RepID=A0A419W463_9BACT|nr:LytTR family DNA-binding domain-containing protein [Mangrovibacterium diazotrophicum]RKD90251.1 LytTR family two component transcriptional regulator [Mangrovibacterium diazotrophicum]
MKILIVEDEPQTADLLAELITEIKPSAEFVGTTESIEQTVRFLQTNKPDVIFMDIQLADGLSFEIFSRTEVACPVIFCTAYDRYTLQAFKSNGIEYLLKPVREEDVQAAFDKLDKLASAFKNDQQVMQSIQQLFTEKKSYKSTVLIRYRESYIPVPVNQIALFALEDEVLYAYRFDDQKHAVFKTLDEMESSLDPAMFYRINRQVLLNRNAIVEIQPYFNRKMVVKVPLKLSEKLVVSRLKVTPFLSWVEQA